MEKDTIVIDGRLFTDFDEFTRVVGEAFYRRVGYLWNGNLDALDELLDRVEGQYCLVWQITDLSRHCLGHSAMAKWLGNNMQRCDPDFILTVAERLRRARLGKGPTLFDWLVGIIQRHPQIELILE